jgi:hypothetical protein
MIARNKPPVRVGSGLNIRARGQNRRNAVRAHVSYRAFLRARAFRPFYTNSNSSGLSDGAGGGAQASVDDHDRLGRWPSAEMVESKSWRRAFEIWGAPELFVQNNQLSSRMRGIGFVAVLSCHHKPARPCPLRLSLLDPVQLTDRNAGIRCRHGARLGMPVSLVARLSPRLRPLSRLDLRRNGGTHLPYRLGGRGAYLLAGASTSFEFGGFGSQFPWASACIFASICRPDPSVWAFFSWSQSPWV